MRRMPYEEQLASKKKTLQDALRKMSRNLKQFKYNKDVTPANKATLDWLHDA
jgi:hypothetical protein